MSERNLIHFPQGTLQTANKPSLTRAKSFEIKAKPHNILQFVRTVKAYAAAGMTFEHIANAGNDLGETVERAEIDAPLQDGWQNKIGEVVESNGQILAWQARGEKISVTPQLSSPSSVIENKIIPISKYITASETVQEKTIDVLEGIKVIQKEDPQHLPTSTDNRDLTNSPYLQPIVDYKKAA